MTRNTLVGLALTTLCVRLAGQTFDFESGIADWHQEGSAFLEPYCKEISSTIFAASKLGGTYWRGMEYPLGHRGRCL